MSATTTFCELIERHGRVEIPVIQRDYAQGRADQAIIRKDFLKALEHALCRTEDDSSLPLNLDFVYGSVVNGSFQPLDGQQRLTTLFLLHWYLAWVDDCYEDFRSRLIDSKGKSRFSYEVRPGSRDFINAFAGYDPGVPAADCENLGAMITDQPWYFRSWRLDPTIRSALSMLEGMHKYFRHTSGYYARLINETAPAITFQLLDLKQFDLSDDLYIKMNARGKPLTPLEAFKAHFKPYLERESFDGALPNLCGEALISDFFSHQIDTHWSDFFWPFRDQTATFDAAVMNLLRVVIMVTRDPYTDKTAGDLADLRASTQASSYAWFYEESWLDKDFILALITLLKRWSAGPGASFRCYLPDTQYLDEYALFQKIITRPADLTFQQLAQLAGYVQYLVHAHKEIDPVAFNAWMRVVSNLAINTTYNRPDDLRRSFVGLRGLIPRMNDIMGYLAGPEGDVQGFSVDQVVEERIKAHLIGFGNGWPERIDRAERHPYFRGQIAFLLRFCGLNLKPGAELVRAELARLDTAAAHDFSAPFEHYFVYAAQMFEDLVKDSRGIGWLWECALLAVGNFLLPINLNYSLLTTAQDEAWSWKRLLRNAAEGGHEGHMLKDLWDRLGEPASIATDLPKIIESESNIDPWRKAILATPMVYEYGKSKGRMLRFECDRVYLLRKSQMNGMHAELFTYCLCEDLDAASGSLALMVSYKEMAGTADEPGLSLSWHFGGEDVTFYFCLEIDLNEYKSLLEEPEEPSGDLNAYKLLLEEPEEPSGDLCAVLEGEEFEEREGRWIKVVDRAGMKSAVLSLDSALAQ